MRRLVSFVLTRYEGEPIRFESTADGFRYEFANGAVIYTTELDLLTPKRLRAEADKYYLPRTSLSEGETVVDAGASVGTFTYVAAAAVGPSGRVLAVESHPETFRRLEKGVEESRFENIDCVHAALVGEDGEVLVSTGDDYRLSSVSRPAGKETEDAAEATSVRAVTLDALVNEFGLDCVDLVKMNIEGAETEALRGADKLTSGGRLTAVAVSCHDFMADETGDEGYRTRTDVEGWLTGHGFNVDWGSESSDEPPIRDYAWATRR